MQVSLEILQRFNGAALKVAILLENHPDGLTAKELASMLRLTDRCVYKALDELNKCSQIERMGTKFMNKRSQIEQTFKEKERSKEKRNNNIINTSTTTSTIDTHESFDESNDPFSWLTDDEETMTALVMNNRLPAEQTPLETLRPYIETFLDREKAKGPISASRAELTPRSTSPIGCLSI